MAESYPNGLKTPWEKEKLLVTKQFLLFPQCFQKACSVDTQKPGLVWERVTVYSKRRFSCITYAW